MVHLRRVQRSLPDEALTHVNLVQPVSPVDDGKVAQIDTSVRKEYPLLPTLAALGVDIPGRIDQWDLDLGKLKISTSELKRLMGAKKRAGLEEVQT